MRKAFILFIAVCSCVVVHAQRKGGPGGKGGHSLGSFFQQSDRKHAKYFIGLSYGVGQAWWNSHLGDAELYDPYGGVIKSGKIDFKAKNSTNSIALDGSVPVARVRLGIAITFDYFFLDKLELIETGKSPEYVLYPESFRFDKFSAFCEVPFNFESERAWSLAARAHIGYFGFSYVDHFSLFGDEALAKTYYTSVGLVGDIRLYPHSYLFCLPNLEYKLYDNNNSENPVQIHHNIFSWSVMAGIRIDVSKER
jgi:hypothetical protein